MSGTTGTTQPAPRGTLILIGVCLTVGFACPAVAGHDPALTEVWTTNSTQAVTLIGAELSGA